MYTFIFGVFLCIIVYVDVKENKDGGGRERGVEGGREQRKREIQVKPMNCKGSKVMAGFGAISEDGSVSYVPLVRLD